MFHWEAMEPVPGSLAGREPDPFPKAVSGNLQALFLFLAFLGAELHFSALAEAEAPASELVPWQL